MYGRACRAAGSTRSLDPARVAALFGIGRPFECLLEQPAAEAAPGTMFMMREVLHSRPGKVGELVKRFKSLNDVIEDKGYTPFRIYTDVSGENFWTVVLETEAESMAAFKAMEDAVMTDERAGKIMSGYHDFIQDGRREIYRVEE